MNILIVLACVAVATYAGFPSTASTEIQVTRLGPNFGARIDGDMAMMDTEKLQELLWEHKLLVAHDQSLNANEFRTFASSFGPLMAKKSGYYPTAEGFNDVHVLEFDETNLPHLNVWHTDHTWKEFPSDIETIYMEEVPEFGGDTMFSDATMAFETLSDLIKNSLMMLECEHDIVYGYEKMGTPREALLVMQEKFPPITHPCIVRHHSSGEEILFINYQFTKKINGLSPIVDIALRTLISDHFKTPEFQLRHKWHKGDLVMWDNWALQHYAVADYSQTRRLLKISRIGANSPQDFPAFVLRNNSSETTVTAFSKAEL